MKLNPTSVLLGLAGAAGVLFLVKRAAASEVTIEGAGVTYDGNGDAHVVLLPSNNEVSVPLGTKVYASKLNGSTPWDQSGVRSTNPKVLSPSILPPTTFTAVAKGATTIAAWDIGDHRLHATVVHVV